MAKTDGSQIFQREEALGERLLVCTLSTTGGVCWKPGHGRKAASAPTFQRRRRLLEDRAWVRSVELRARLDTATSRSACRWPKGHKGEHNCEDLSKCSSNLNARHP
eukprot:1153119-Pelagomonas_calceolata.AAC.5